ncbi:hypothetical protein AB0F18_30725 [Streptomyces sp. NPDC029216]|uniref:hypothetical protein n=1 Tax=Streptomyces sp. NPDC029216 TaxID=3154701 RepID=UPI0033D03BFD
MTTALTAALATIGSPASAAECGVRSDGRLHCGNRAGDKGYADRSYRSATRGTLVGTFSWFQCWGHGDPHLGTPASTSATACS